MTKTTTKYGIVGITALVAVLAMSTVAIALSQSAIAAPANKTVMGSGDIGVLASSDGWYSIISGTIKTSTPSDLIVNHNQECVIHTGLNLNQDVEKATSAVREDIRLLVDGKVIPAAYGDKDGIVTLCGRAYEIDTNVLSTVFELCGFLEGDAGFNRTDICTAEEIYFDSFIRTKQAHSWSWVVLDVGSGVHDIEVQAKLFNELDGVGDKSGKKGKATDSGACTDKPDCVDTILEIGKRNLIVSEEKLATGSSLG